MTVIDTKSAPEWDVSAYFPSLESREFVAAEERFGSTIERAVALYDRHGVRTVEPAPENPLDAEHIAAFDEVLAATNSAYEEAALLRSYVHAFVSTDTTNQVAQAAMSRLQMTMAELSKLATRFDAWVASLGAEDLIAVSDSAQSHDWPLRKASRRAANQMSEPEEDLAAELALTGSSAWSQLYSDVSAGIMATVDLGSDPNGDPKGDSNARATEHPIFAVRGMATSPDPAVRRAAYDAELQAWEQNAVPIAAALNAIKGEQQTLALRRGWPSVLDAQLFGQAVDRSTLDAMQASMIDSFSSWRKYLRAKGELLGHDDGLPFWDLFAPVGNTEPRSWDEAKAAVDAAFASYSPQLQALARRAYDESWIDVAPRRGKQGGAFCMPMGDGDSRVLLNYNGAVEGFMTLAHELGHAYHNSTMAGRTPIQKGTPSSLAETASIFCETIMVQYGLATLTDDAERLALLDVDLQGSCQVIVDIHSRFLFESSVFEERAKSKISPARFCELMADAQEATYGNGLAADHRHPWMWAAKPHYYGSLFYNWPYAFGLLFGLGLYARYEEDPERFKSGYDDLLSATGLGEAADLAGRFDIDIRDRAFWDASMKVLTNRIDDFCHLAIAQRG